MMNKLDKIDIFYRYLLYFAIFAFVGWAFETVAVYFDTGHWQARGFFFIGPRLGLAFQEHSIKPLEAFHFWGLPAIEMYGIGGLLIVILIKRFQSSFWKTFLASAFYMTIFELLTSYWVEAILHTKYWDYSNDFLNFEGRICLRSSIAWGILGVIVINFFEPWLHKIDTKYKNYKYYHLFLIIFGILMIACALVKYIFYQNIMPSS